MSTVFEDAADRLSELCNEAVAGGASSWYVETLRRRVAALRPPATLLEARKVLGIVEAIEAVTRKRSDRFEEVLEEVLDLVRPIDAVWRLGGGGDA